MGPRCRAPGHNKKRQGNDPRKLKKIERRHKRKLKGKEQKHDDAVKRVAGPSRTGKARTKAARALKRKLKEMAADGTITAADFEMAEADADAELAAAASAKDVKVKAAGIKVGKKKVIKAAPAPKAVRASTRQSARLAAADSGVAAMDE